MTSRSSWRPPPARGTVGDNIILPDLSHEELALLLGLGERLVSELDLENVLALVAETACQVVQAETLVVPMVAPDRKTFTYRAANGKYAEMILGETFPIHEGACGWVIKHRRPLLFGDRGTFDLDPSAQWQPGMASSLLVPLICRGVIIGGLSAMGKQGGGAFNPRDLTVLTLFANQASIAIDNARLFKTLDSERTRLDTILRTASDGIHILDGDGLLIEANDAFLDMLGYDKAAVGHLHVSDWDVQDAWSVIRGRNNALIDTKSTAIFETRHKRKDGEIIDVEINACGIDIEGERLLYAASRDITERKRAEAALRELNATLERRVQEVLAQIREKDHILIEQSRLAAMGEMVHNIAHQWRQPLNALSLTISNLKDDFDFGTLTRSEMADYAQRVLRTLQTMSSTIDDFRDFFRPDHEASDFDVGKAVEGALFIMEASLHNNQIEVVKSLPPGLRIEGYANQFAQAVLNLIANAKEAIQERKVIDGRIEITLSPVGEGAELVIQDNGGGIRPDVLPHIFEPYFTTKEKGSGIGLYMTKMIIERNHGGRIEARNEGRGARMAIVLPRLLAAT